MISPGDELGSLAKRWGYPLESQEFAERLDADDPLASCRDLFCIPKKIDLTDADRRYVQDKDEKCLYFCGHSLGLMPKSVEKTVNKVLDNWKKRGSEAHVYGFLPAAMCDLPLKEPMVRLIGAKPEEVVFMNGLSVNLHILLLSFYKPNKNRYKILIEDHAFPSDMYVAKSQLTAHGYDETSGLIKLVPREGEESLREQDILRVIETEGDKIAVVFLPGTQYYTGQVFDIARITEAAHKQGCIVLWDLAHSVGNVRLRLHEWNVDVAAWCTYKYLNSGPGGIAAAFVHSRHFDNPELPRLQGWWGNRQETKFNMHEVFDPCSGADKFKLSNPPPLLIAPLMASLEIFSAVQEEDRLHKQFLLTGYLELLLKRLLGATHNPDPNHPVRIITPEDPSQRGSQLSVAFHIGIHMKKELRNRGVQFDFRKPQVFRFAPIPLYNTFQEVRQLVLLMEKILNSEVKTVKKPLHSFSA